VYHSNFVSAQAPVLLSYIAASGGFHPPDPRQVFRYLELGCGSGATLNGIAAACPEGQFTGVDFNPASIAAARRTAAAAGLSNVRYVEAPFSGVDIADLGEMDYIACMGTYSWLDQTEKAALIRLFQGCLTDGGLLYLGFISLGRTAVTPMWQILRSLVPESSQDSIARLKCGIDLLVELRDQGARFLQDNPRALALLNEVHAQCLAGNNQALINLSHNLLADGFRAELLDEVVADLATAGLTFCGSAMPYANDPDLSVPPALRGRYDALPTRIAQELMKDFLAATVVRTDVFIKGSSPDAGLAQHYMTAVAKAALVADPAETWRQLERPDWTNFSFSIPAIRFVYGKLVEGAAGIDEIAVGAPFGVDAICDAFCKLVASPGIELCMNAPHGPTSPLPARVRPASGYNKMALDAARAGVATVHLAAPGLGSCVPLTLPGSLLLAELCTSGTAVPLDVLQANLAKISRIDAATARQVADPRFFAQLHQVVSTRALPLFLRFGALVPG
jgi:SAM-dependent methyltransferase